MALLTNDKDMELRQQKPSPSISSGDFDSVEQLKHNPSISSSDLDNMDQPSTQDLPTDQGKKFAFSSDSFPWRDIAIHPDNTNAPAYFASVSVYSKGTPDVTLRSKDANGPTVGQCHFRASRALVCGLGFDELSMEWVDVKRPLSLTSKKFRFEFDGRKYELCRTRDAEHGVSGLNRVLASHYKIFEESSGEVVAFYSSEVGIGKKKGSLTLARGVEGRLEVLMVLVIASIRERARRRRAATAGGAAGASG